MQIFSRRQMLTLSSLAIAPTVIASQSAPSPAQYVRLDGDPIRVKRIAVVQATPAHLEIAFSCDPDLLMFLSARLETQVFVQISGPNDPPHPWDMLDGTYKCVEIRSEFGHVTSANWDAVVVLARNAN